MEKTTMYSKVETAQAEFSVELTDQQVDDRFCYFTPGNMEAYREYRATHGCNPPLFYKVVCTQHNRGTFARRPTLQSKTVFQSANYREALAVYYQYLPVMVKAARPQPVREDGWKEATIAWAVCGSIHRKFARGKDALYTTRQADFVKHEEDARSKALSA